LATSNLTHFLGCDVRRAQASATCIDGAVKQLVTRNFPFLEALFDLDQPWLDCSLHPASLQKIHLLNCLAKLHHVWNFCRVLLDCLYRSLGSGDFLAWLANNLSDNLVRVIADDLDFVAARRFASLTRTLDRLNAVSIDGKPLLNLPLGILIYDFVLADSFKLTFLLEVVVVEFVVELVHLCLHQLVPSGLVTQRTVLVLQLEELLFQLNARDCRHIELGIRY
jgi:hypothetical protein